MGWIFAIAALLTGLLFGLSPALALAAAALVWLGHRVNQLEKRISALGSRLDALDPTAPPATVALAHTAIDSTIDPPGSGDQPGVQAAPEGPPGPRSEAVSTPHSDPGDDPVGTQPAALAPTDAASTDAWRASAAVATPDNPLAKLVTGARQQLRHFFSGGNLIVRIGIIVLFFGLSFLARYSIDKGLIPIEWRLIAIAAVALIMLLTGWRLRQRASAYALLLQGGGVAMLYLTLYSSYRLYALLDAPMAFGLMLLISLLAMLLAVPQNSRALALTAITGAFATPLLTSDDSGSHVALFSYYALLNFTIFSIAWFKSWRLLNLVGYGFTFAVTGLWATLRYQPELYQSSQFFLVVFVLQFVAIAVLFAHRQPPRLKGLVDGTLIFGTPLAGFTIQALLVESFARGLAISAVVSAVFYLALAALTRRQARAQLGVLVESFTALGLIFATLAIPLAVSDAWTSAAWAIEGSLFVWLGDRQRRLLPMLSGFALQAAAAVFFASEVQLNAGLSGATLAGGAIIALSALATAAITQRAATLARYRRQTARAFLGWGLLWWYASAATHIIELLTQQLAHLALLALIGGSALLADQAMRRLRLRMLVNLPWLSLLLMAVTALMWPAPASIANWLSVAAGWWLVLALHFHLLRVQHHDSPARPLWQADGLFAASWLLGAAVTSLLATSLLALLEVAQAWRLAALAVVLCAAVAAPLIRPRNWPFANYPNAFGRTAPSILMMVLAAWSAYNMLSIEVPTPLRFVPGLNPMDAAQLLIVVTFFYWRGSAGIVDRARHLLLAGGIAVFAWGTSLLLKTLHVVQDIPYMLPALYFSATVQSSLSIAWTIVGLCTAIYATRYRRRAVWYCAAALLAVVVAKLFLIDLTDQDSITRIASFVGVGGLLLVVGYFAPLPPARPPTEAPSEVPPEAP